MLKYLFLLPANLGLTILNYLGCWLIAAFVGKDWKLPNWLFWFSTTDALMNGKGTRPDGGGGDGGFYDRHVAYGNSIKKFCRKYLFGIGQTRIPIWFTSMFWLCRNPINGFDESVCKGVVEDPVKVIGDIKMETSAKKLFRITHFGWESILDAPFELYFKWRYSSKFMMRIRIGWKLSEFVENPGLKGDAQYVFVPNPCKRIN